MLAGHNADTGPTWTLSPMQQEPVVQTGRQRPEAIKQCKNFVLTPLQRFSFSASPATQGHGSSDGPTQAQSQSSAFCCCNPARPGTLLRDFSSWAAQLHS